jgi:hypothetical protein
MSVMTPREKAIARLRLAALSGIYSGLIRTVHDAQYMARCKADVRVGDTYNRLIFTRDSGHHSSGWWKNPDYERCFHLSVSFAYLDESPAPFDAERAMRWAKDLFREHVRWVWVEPPYSPEGKVRDVHHYRLFCDEGWQAIKPRGEVYSRELTEAGWKSFSEIHGVRAEQFEPPMGYAP